jgi:hypothetical protein
MSYPLLDWLDVQASGSSFGLYGCVLAQLVQPAMTSSFRTAWWAESPRRPSGISAVMHSLS